MKISFYEEFPTEKNLKKARMLGFASRIILGATSVSEYLKIIKDAKQYLPKNIEFSYWPILSKSEGYWFSAFSEYDAVKRTVDEIRKNDRIKNDKISVMWDAEPPLMTKRLYLSNLKTFFKTKRLIKRFVRDYERIEISQLPITNWLGQVLMRFAGISFPNEKTIRMAYQSFVPKAYKRRFLRRVINSVSRNKKPWEIGLGVISEGILGKEKPLEPKELKKSLEMCSNAGIDEVVIYRLGGINEEHLKLMGDVNR